MNPQTAVPRRNSPCMPARHKSGGPSRHRLRLQALPDLPALLPAGKRRAGGFIDITQIIRFKVKSSRLMICRIVKIGWILHSIRNRNLRQYYSFMTRKRLVSVSLAHSPSQILLSLSDNTPSESIRVPVVRARGRMAQCRGALDRLPNLNIFEPFDLHLFPICLRRNPWTVNPWTWVDTHTLDFDVTLDERQCRLQMPLFYRIWISG